MVCCVDGQFELLESLEDDSDDSEMEAPDDEFGGVHVPTIPSGVLLS